MAFEDWYSGGGAKSGAVQGASIGSMFGGPGAAIGAVAGGALGTLTGGKGRSQQRRMERKLTASSYEFGKELFAYAKEASQVPQIEYEAALSSLTARMGASGAMASESFRLQKGKLIMDRDAAIANIQQEVADFRAGENYEWLRKDFADLTEVRREDGRLGKGATSVTYQVGVSEGRTGEIAYTEAQRASMRTYVAQVSNPTMYAPDKRRLGLFQQYAERIKPTLEQYESFVFGDAAAKKAYQSQVDANIAQANKWYDAQVAIIDAERAAKANRPKRGGDLK